MNKFLNNGLLVILILVSFCFLSISGCGCSDDADVETNRSSSSDDYTHTSGGNEATYETNSSSSSDDYSHTSGRNDPTYETNKSYHDKISIVVDGYKVFVNGLEFDDVGESLDYIQELREKNDLSVTIDIERSRTKTVVELEEGLKDKGIFYNFGES